MLVLSRKLGEKIYIGDNIVITLVRIQGDKTRIGIEAPRAIPVHRSEVREKIKLAESSLAFDAGRRLTGPVPPVSPDPSSVAPRNAHAKPLRRKL
jgi:carbon storage regulator